MLFSGISRFPSGDHIGGGGKRLLAVSPDGPVTLVFGRYVSPSTQVYTLITMDGGPHWEGPYKQTNAKLAGLGWMRSARSMGGGRVEAAWGEAETWTNRGVTCAESHDDGRTFRLRDYLPYPPNGDTPSLGIAPDGTRCMVLQAEYYVEYR
ncbi:MAG: hypothetical protein U1E76_18935 [Planctomycetota bacterium]